MVSRLSLSSLCLPSRLASPRLRSIISPIPLHLVFSFLFSFLISFLQKFRFCGDFDCPDWLLNEIGLLSKLSSIRMMLLCRQIIHHLLGNVLDSEKIQKLTRSSRLSLDANEISALIASVEFILKNSAKFGVSESILLTELEQLGLPQDISVSIVKQYSLNAEALRKRQMDSILSLPAPSAVHWRVDFLVDSNVAPAQPQPECHLQMVFDQQKQLNGNTFHLHLDREKFLELYGELKAAKAAMDSVK